MFKLHKPVRQAMGGVLVGVLVPLYGLLLAHSISPNHTAAVVSPALYYGLIVLGLWLLGVLKLDGTLSMLPACLLGLLLLPYNQIPLWGGDYTYRIRDFLPLSPFGHVLLWILLVNLFLVVYKKRWEFRFLTALIYVEVLVLVFSAVILTPRIMYVLSQSPLKNAGAPAYRPRVLWYLLQSMGRLLPYLLGLNLLLFLKKDRTGGVWLAALGGLFVLLYLLRTEILLRIPRDSGSPVQLAIQTLDLLFHPDCLPLYAGLMFGGVWCLLPGKKPIPVKPPAA